MSVRYRGTFAFQKDIGKVRVTNEDQCMVLTNASGEVFMIVCDGMGGQNKGDYASKMAVDSLADSFVNKPAIPFFLIPSWLSRIYRLANSIIFEEAESRPTYKDMGTTAVCVLITGKRCFVANCGDSRAYMLKQGELQRLTEDQTYVDYLYRAGKISEEAKKTRDDRHVLMNALGVYPSCSVDIRHCPYAGETILVCSDGLYNNLAESEIRAALQTDERVDQKAEALIREANGNGGSDNIAVALWESIDHD